MPTNDNTTSAKSLQPGGKMDRQASSSTGNKTSPDEMGDDEDSEPWDSTTTVSYKEHLQFLANVVKSDTLLNYLNSPPPPIAEGLPLPLEEAFQSTDIPLVLGLLKAGPRNTLNTMVYKLSIDDGAKLIEWLELCCEVDLRALGIWKAGEEVVQRNTLTKFARHLLGIGKGEVNWDSLSKLKTSLNGRVRHWRKQKAGAGLECEWREWGVARVTKKKQLWWMEQYEAGWTTSRGEIDGRMANVYEEMANVYKEMANLHSLLARVVGGLPEGEYRDKLQKDVVMTKPFF